jgi:2-amino-4-hydroxy-6-hydroxymethyldihydropteridine diphosphokinase
MAFFQAWLAPAEERMRTAVGLGSNLGDRLNNLRAARDAIVRLAAVSPPVVVSPLYETEPVDCEPGAGKFLNAVMEFDCGSHPADLLEQFIRIEQSLGRSREDNKNISRTIDIDLLYCGEQKIQSERLQLPHPRMHERKFVLQPLADIRPELVLPDQTKSVRELLAQLQESPKVIRLMEQW